MRGDGDLRAAQLTEPATTVRPGEPAVLLIEDDPGDTLLTREYLTDSGISSRFEHAGSLAEAVAVPTTPDCVLLDLHLPDGQGLSALRRVLDRWPGTAVLVLTGLDDAAMGAAAVAAGA